MSEERFSTTFARKPARPPRGIAPGRRVWTTLCATAVATAAVAGTTTVAARVLGPDDAAPVASGTVPGALPDAPAPAEDPPPPPDGGEDPDARVGADEETDEPEPPEAEAEPPPDQPAPPAPDSGPATGSGQGGGSASGGGDGQEDEPEAPEAPDEPEPRDDPAPPAPPAVTGPSGHIIGLAGKCAEVPGGAVGTGSQIGDCDDSPNQRWLVASDGTLRVAGKCLALSGGSTNDGARAVLAACDPSDTRQHWRIERAAGDIVNVAADKCLDVANANASSGTPLQIAWCSGNAAQKWSAP